MINNSQIFDKKTALNLGTLYPPKVILEFMRG